jgi:hypothetical protein
MTVIRCVACGVTFISGLAFLDRTHRCILNESKVCHPSNPRSAS